jgi:hypothetical protein
LARRQAKEKEMDLEIDVGGIKRVVEDVPG